MVNYFEKVKPLRNWTDFSVLIITIKYRVSLYIEYLNIYNMGHDIVY